MMLKLEENELLAALLTAQEMERFEHPGCATARDYALAWRSRYQIVLREFIELEKAEEPK